MAAKPIPEGHHTVTPYLLLHGAGKLIDFLKRAFNAQEMMRHALPDGRIMHAQVKIGDSILMMGEPPPEWKPVPASFYLYVPDVDAVYNQAMSAGAVSMSAPRDEFYGDRVSGVKDPFENTWWIATHKEDVSDEELMRRMGEAMKKRQSS